MLKTVSAITNAIGALNYKGTWNASTNTPALASSVGKLMIKAGAPASDNDGTVVGTQT